jgi:rubrerythrin
MNSIAKNGTPMEILEAALKKEHAAHDFYAAVREHAKVESVRLLAEELCDEEMRHVHLIEDHIARLRRG